MRCPHDKALTSEAVACRRRKSSLLAEAAAAGARMRFLRVAGVATCTVHATKAYGVQAGASLKFLPPSPCAYLRIFNLFVTIRRAAYT
jgi:hypothetical protein